MIDYCRQLAHDGSFRPNSTADCCRALFEKRCLRPERISKRTGKPLTDKDTLQVLSNEGDSLSGGIIDARSAIAQRGQLRHWKPFAIQGFVQPYWNSLGTPHGRFTSEAPCLNNRIVPIRETIEPDSRYSFLSLDLGQAKYVTWASLSGDLALGEMFLQGKDFHEEMAREIKAVVPDWNFAGQEPRAAGKTLTGT